MKEVYHLKFNKLCRRIYVICILWAKNWSGHSYCVFLQMYVLSNNKFKYERLLLHCNSFIWVLVFKWSIVPPFILDSYVFILLQFQEFETEKSFDTVQILVGGRTEDNSVNLATLSGKQDLSNKLFVSASNFMIIKFSTDASVERKGFRLVQYQHILLFRD